MNMNNGSANMQSEQINELAAALAKAQSAFTHATKDSKNPHFGNRYADLASVWEAIRGPMTEAGLSVSQSTDITEHGNVVLFTTLLHSSGQWLRSRYPIMPVKSDPQGYGSALTYARRYCLAAIVGITQDDDDGNAGSGRPEAAPQAAKATAKRMSKPEAPPESKAAEKPAAALSAPNDMEGRLLDYQSKIDEQTTKDGIDKLGLEIAKLDPALQQALRPYYRAQLATILKGGANA